MPVVKIEDLQYRGVFNPDPTRKMLGLDGAGPSELPACERARLASLLLRGGHITPDEIRALGGEVRPLEPSEDDPFERAKADYLERQAQVEITAPRRDPSVARHPRL